MAANITKMGYVPRLGSTDLMKTLDWENNKMTYYAGIGAVVLIFGAIVIKKKKKRKKGSSQSQASKPSSSPMGINITKVSS